MEVRTFVGAAVSAHIADLARLRIEVFREYPYLYDGSLEYEAEYLAGYAKSPRSVFAVAFDGPRVVGASTGMPLTDETPAFQQPFVSRGVPLESVFYFAESVLQASYRGQGLGHRFFDLREAHALAHGFPLTAFCAVERPDDHPRKPLAHRENDAFWAKRGYVKQPNMTCELEWKDLDEAQASKKKLCFWMRSWP